MRRLAQPDVLKSAIIAALVGAVLCCPRLVLWSTRNYPLWYLEAVLFFCGIVLWGFVFAWHTHYSGRPVFTVKWSLPLFATATIVGILAAVGMHYWVDPTMRAKTPEAYPASLEQWIAMTLFSLACSQLLVLFAPFAWLIRLFRDRRTAMVLTVFFGIALLSIKLYSLATPLPWLLFVQVAAARMIGGFLAVWFYLRGGVLLVSWMALLMEARLLAGLG
jgi:hypothetical protein